MKRFLRSIRIGKRGFTLMEVVVAIAILGVISGIILPLTSSAIRTFAAARSLRTVAQEAEKANVSGTSNGETPLYVTITFTNTSDNQTHRAESKFIFTNASASEGTYDVTVHYYELKYGDEKK